MFKLKTIAVAAGLMAMPALSQAAAPTLSEVLKASGITVSGAVDASYDFNDSDLPFMRQFDNATLAFPPATETNTFALHQVNLLVTKDFGNGVSVTLNPILGDDAGVLKGLPSPSSGLETALFQGYVSYATGGLTISGGRMATLAGYEVVNPAGNSTASRSFLFFNQPLVHTGVRASYKLNDMLAFTLGVHNAGLGFATVDNNTDKTLEAQVAVTPVSGLSMYLTGYMGKEDAGSPLAGSATNDVTVLDFVASYTINDMLSVAINADYIETDDAAPGVTFSGNDIRGVAAYVTAKVMPKLSLTVRGELVSFDDGAGGTADLHEGTLVANYSVTDALSILAEVRADGSSNDDNPYTQHGIPGDSSYQNSGSLKAILKF